MKASTKTIKQYTHTGPCRIHDAICLIYGFEPSAMIIENRDNYRERRFQHRVIEFETLLSLLCPDLIWWRPKHSIFYYVEKTLKNNITVSKQLINVIQQYMKNLTEIDCKYFQTNYPYIIKQFPIPQNDIMTINEHAHEKHSRCFTAIERNKKYQEKANEIWMEKPDLTKEEIAQQVYETLSKEDPDYLIDKRGEKQIAVSTVLKNFRKKRR